MRISEINVFPVKSLKGIRVKSALVEERGLENDRRFMLIDEKRTFITQREFPVLARFETEFVDDGFMISFDGEKILLPTINDFDNKLNVKIWSSTAKAIVCDESINEWFSDKLKIKTRLVYMPDDSKRIVSPFYSIKKYKDIVSFADGYPVLLIGEESLADLNSKLETPIPMDRFRTNLVVSGSEAFAEDSWKRIRICKTIFQLMKPCARCVMTTIDQTKGEKQGSEPLKTLSSYRNKKGKVMFGQNLIAENFGETINLGDEIEVLGT
jgi:uncharacterized protein